VLGVPETASHAEILSAFRTRIRAVHPDLNDGKGDRETLELLVRARQMLTGPDRISYLDARARRAAAASPAPGRPRQSAPPKPDEPHLDFSEVFRRARAAQRRQPAPPGQASRRTVHDDAVSEGARQAEAVRDEVRQTTRSTVDIPERPSNTRPHYERTPYEGPKYTRPHYEPLRYERTQYTPRPRYTRPHYEPLRYQRAESPPPHHVDPFEPFLRPTGPDVPPGEAD
jgi:curved DNA-binding protein CbpA